jgi:cysteinyl-tRNA synthetase
VDAYPRATEHIGEMTDLVQRLLDRGHAYTTDDGSVFFDISSFPGYGKLSRIPLDEVRPGERVAADEYAKGDARDFALWKAPRTRTGRWAPSGRRRGARVARAGTWSARP